MASHRSEVVSSEVIRLLQEKRVAKGLSMNAVATAAGLSHTMVSRVERGLRKPTLDTVLRLSGAIGVELSPLVREAELRSPLPGRAK